MRKNGMDCLTLRTTAAILAWLVVETELGQAMLDLALGGLLA